MKKVLFDRLPDGFIRILTRTCSQEDWDGFSPEMQKRLLLEFHEQCLNMSKTMVQLILEIEND